VTAAAALLADLGHRVEEVDLAELAEPTPFGVVSAAGVARELARLSAAAGVSVEPDELEPLPSLVVGGAGAMSARDYLAAVDEMHAFGRRLEAHWADFDLLLTPTVPQVPPRIGELGPHTDLAVLGPGLGARTVLVAPFDVTGQPAISLPLHWTDDGLPVGVQLVAATGAGGSAAGGRRPARGRPPVGAPAPAFVRRLTVPSPA